MTTLNKITLFVVLFSVYSIAQISITSTNFTYTQNFNTLNYFYGPYNWSNNITIPGWALYIEESILQYYGGDGSSSSMGAWSYGPTNQTDRALGSLSMGNISWGVHFVNNSGIELINIPVEFTGEQWRAVNKSAQYIDFAYSLNAFSLDDPNADWVSVGSMRFISPITFQFPETALDGNLIANRILKSTILNITLGIGQAIWFKWQRNSVLPAWHGLAIDDFKFNPAGSVLPVELSSFNAVIIGSAAKLKWTTDTEVNNFGFEIERSTPLYPLSRGEAEGRGVWKTIGFVNGYGNSNSPKYYSFEDNALPDNANTLYYRLKQIDNDGQFEYSEIVEISFKKPMDFSLNQNYPNPFNPVTSIQYSIASSQYVQLKVYDILGNEVAALVDEYKPEGMYDVQFTTNGLASGIYFYQLKAGSFLETKKMIITK